MKLPAITFYPGDWLRDDVSGVSLAAQGLWLRMMILAHDADRYGYLGKNGSPYSSSFIAKKCGCDTVDQYETLLLELDSVNVPSRTPEGVLYSRRMVRDAKERQLKRISWRQQKQEQRKSNVVMDDVRKMSGGMSAHCPPLSSSSVSSSISKDLKPLKPSSEDAKKLSLLLAELITINDPGSTFEGKSFHSWEKAADGLLKHREYGEIEQVLRWSQADSFWKSNILSMSKFKEKYTQLKIRMESTAGRPQAKDDKCPECRQSYRVHLAYPRADGSRCPA